MSIEKQVQDAQRAKDGLITLLAREHEYFSKSFIEQTKKEIRTLEAVINVAKKAQAKIVA